MREKLEVSGLLFEVRRSPRRKTLGLTVDRGGGIIIYSPVAVSKDELARWTHSRLLWVYSKLALKEEMTPKVREPEFVTGESVYYLGRSYRLKVIRQQDEALRFDGRHFYLRTDAKDFATDHFRHWYVSVGKDWISKRIDFLAPKAGIAPARIEIRDLGFRWGSCGKNRVVFFNWKLLQLPIRVIDYVVTHELVHLKESHHGPEFWCALEHALPDWRERRDLLGMKGREIYWCQAEMGK